MIRTALMIRCCSLPLTILILSATVRAAPGPDLAPVQRWIERTANVKSMVADFKQERHLRTVRKPLVSTGRMWLTAAGAFRWQAGDPPKLIAVTRPGAPMTVLHPDKKEAEVISRETMEKEGGAQGMVFLHAGFPKTLAALQKRFQVLAVVPEGEWTRIELKPAGGDASFAVRKAVLLVHQRTQLLGSMQVHFRDGSWLNNTFSNQRENTSIPSSQFEADLGGYQVKKR